MGSTTDVEKHVAAGGEGLLRGIILGLLLTCVATDRAYATHIHAFAVDAATSVNSLILANPPLPMLYNNKGDYKITLQPYTFQNGKMKDDPQSQGFEERGKMDAWGLGGGASYAFANKWATYGFILGSQMSGDFNHLDHESVATFPSRTMTQQAEVRTSVIMANVGLSYQFFGETEGGFTLPVFFGPVISQTKLKERVLNRTLGGALLNDYDLELNNIQVGMLLGVQAGIPLGEKFQLNPFVIGGYYFNSESDNPRITAVRANGGGTDLNGLLSGTTGFSLQEYMLSAGLNLVYRPWGLSLNVTAPFLSKPLIPSQRPYTPVDGMLFTMSYSFGKYAK